MEFIKNYFKMLDLLKSLKAENEDQERDKTQVIMESTLSSLEGDDLFVEFNRSYLLKKTFKMIDSVKDLETKSKMIAVIVEQISKVG